MKKLILIIIAAQIFLLTAIASTGDVGDFARTMNPNHLGLHKKEKLTHIRVYWQDSIKGPNPSAAIINQAISNTSYFGMVGMMDDPLTVDVSMNSTAVGHAQGIYAAVGQGEVSFLMVMNFAFKTGKYNGSTIAILGRNVGLRVVREMPIVGGSGIFRFARGYVAAWPKFYDAQGGLATVEYNCYVLHY